MNWFYRLGKVVTGIIYRFWFKIVYVGRENLPQGGGYILCSNHRTNLDPIFLALRLDRQLYFMAKEELFRGRFVGAVLRKLGAFPVSRGKGDTGALEFAETTVRSGRVLAMFPEGTRSKDGALLRPKSGAALIASHTGADVVPAAICFTGKLRFRSRVVVRYGAVIPNGELAVRDNSPSDIKAASRRIMAEIASLLEEGANGRN